MALMMSNQASYSLVTRSISGPDPVGKRKGPDEVRALMRPISREFGDISLSMGELFAVRPSVNPYGVELRSFCTNFSIVWSPVACSR